MFWDYEITQEEEDEIIEKIAQRMHKHHMEVPAILIFQTLKPVSRLGSTLGQIFVSPFLPYFGDDVDIMGEKVLYVIEKRGNVEKIMRRMEELMSLSEEAEIKESEKQINKPSEKIEKNSQSGKNEKKWWKRFFSIPQ